MAKVRPIKNHGTGLERWKDEKTGKERRKMGLLIQKKLERVERPVLRKRKTKKNWKEKDLF